jgi:hypothetical protein
MLGVSTLRLQPINEIMSALHSQRSTTACRIRLRQQIVVDYINFPNCLMLLRRAVPRLKSLVCGLRQRPGQRLGGRLCLNAGGSRLDSLDG